MWFASSGFIVKSKPEATNRFISQGIRSEHPKGASWPLAEGGEVP